MFSGLQKGELVELVATEVNYSYEYFALLVLSAIIATLGLIIGNSVIIIGAMLLSPLIWPIIGVSLGTVVSRRKLFIHSLVLLVISIFVTLAVALIISLLSPFKELNPEIMLRTNPTFIDLVIALAAGFAAVIVLSWHKYSNHLAGVAIAASVLPPLCVTGIGLAFGSTTIASGSFVLFATNLASIIFIGIAIFALLGFYKKDDKDQVRKIEAGLIFTFIFVLLLGVELVFSFKTIIREQEITRQAREVLEEQLAEISTDIVVASVKVESFDEKLGDVEIVSSIQVPSDVSIDISQKNEIVEILRRHLGREADLELRISPVLKVVAEKGDEQTEQERVVQAAQEIVASHMRSISPDIIVDSVNTKLVEGKIDTYAVTAVVRAPQDVILFSEYKEDLTFALISKLKRPVELNVRLIRYEKL